MPAPRSLCIVDPMATRRLGFFALGLDAVVMLLTAGSLPSLTAA